MKLKQENIIYPVQSSFKVLKYSVPYFKMPFHYHKEYELVYITRGSGVRYIGNSTHKFASGDMVFIGPELGHVWINNKSYHKEKSNLSVEAIVIQFSKDMFSSLIDTPEFTSIRKLFKDSESGLKIHGETCERISAILNEILESKGVTRIINLMKILDILSKDNKLTRLNTIDYSPLSKQVDARINAVHSFVKSYYSQKISIKEAAEIANMEPSAFCRFFKEKTQKTFWQFLTEMRIDHACRLLMEDSLSITQIAYDTGFNNMANFFRQFKKYTGVTPGEYKIK